MWPCSTASAEAESTRTSRDEADHILSSLGLVVSRHGFREYYNPLTGRSLGARNFGMSTLLIDLLAGKSALGRVDPSGARPMIQA